jgi:hypothetical protein
MRQKRVKLSAVILLGLGLTGVKAQKIYVKEKSSTQTAYTMSTIRKITFSGGNAAVLKIDNFTSAYALSELRYLNFTDLITGVSDPQPLLGHGNLITYPNPVTDVINIDLTGVTEDGIISILTLEGKEIQRQNTKANSLTTINLSHISNGIYMCRYINTEGIKTVKIIKQ